ncbi:hypothetical protein HGA91_03785 [candidate division WWE3 bacterium]|nr:hypothetical protein [candidate division WWE3 bacterium]
MHNETYKSPESKQESSTEKPRTQWEFVGVGRAAVRRIDASNPEDMRRMHESFSSPNAEQFLGEPLSDEVQQMIASDEAGIISYAVTETPEQSTEHTGEIDGIVYFAPDLQTKRYLAEKQDIEPEETPVFSITYARAPESHGGSMVDGVIASCLMLSRATALGDVKRESNAKAKFEKQLQQKRTENPQYTIEDELADRQTFEAELTQRYSHPITEVIAYIDPQNDASKRIVEKSGFILQDAINKPNRLMYRLDWEKLHQIVHEQNQGKKTPPAYISAA